jgi:hypothetical protein
MPCRLQFKEQGAVGLLLLCTGVPDLFTHKGNQPPSTQALPTNISIACNPLARVSVNQDTLALYLYVCLGACFSTSSCVAAALIHIPSCATRTITHSHPNNGFTERGGGIYDACSVLTPSFSLHRLVGVLCDWHVWHGQTVVLQFVQPMIVHV